MFTGRDDAMAAKRLTAHREVSRRSFLGHAALAGASVAAASCAQAAAPPGPSGSPAIEGWEVRWQRLIEEAKREGKVAVHFTQLGEGFAKVGGAFEAAFPGIAVDVTTSAGASIWGPRVLQERLAGVYTWDLAQVPAPFVFRQGTLRPAGGLDPIRPLLFHPDVLNDEVWPGGVEGSWIDNEKRWGFAFRHDLFGVIYINTDLVKEGEINSAEDLTNPKWRGRIISIEPRSNGGGFIPATVMRLLHGPELLKRIWVDQQPALTRDPRQAVEGVVRGRYAVGIGGGVVLLREFQAQGQGRT